MFKAALFIITQNWKQLNSSSTGKDKQTVEYPSYRILLRKKKKARGGGGLDN